jgi:hypothetical protein
MTLLTVDVDLCLDVLSEHHEAERARIAQA